MNEIDSLIEELKKDQTITVPTNTPKEAPLTTENLEAFILEKTSKLVNSGLASVEELKEIIQTGVNPEEVASYAEVIRATNSAIDTLNKINIQARKTKTAITLKEMDFEGQKHLPQGGSTQVFIATREDVIKNLLSQVQPVLAEKTTNNTIDVEVEDITLQK